jgi:hypothetical protein
MLSLTSSEDRIASAMAQDKYLGVPEAKPKSEHQWRVAPGATKVNIRGSNRFTGGKAVELTIDSL